MDLEKVLDKVRKLRALANRAGTMAESEAATSAADALIQQYRLCEADIESADPTRREAVGVDETPLDTFARRTHYGRTRLASSLSAHYGCYVLIRSRPHGERKVIICGRTSDVAIVRYMYAWLSAQVDRLSSSETPRARLAFWHGAVSGIQATLAASVATATRAHTEAHGGAAAIVLASRAEEAQKWAKAALGNIGPGYVAKAPNGTGDAMRRGYDAGREIHLGAALPESQTAALPEKSQP